MVAACFCLLQSGVNLVAAVLLRTGVTMLQPHSRRCRH